LKRLQSLRNAKSGGQIEDPKEIEVPDEIPDFYSDIEVIAHLIVTLSKQKK
jgi:hypothetical protein